MIHSAEALAGTLAQPHLRDDERSFRQLLDLLPAAIYTTDQNGLVTFANKAAAELAGRVPEPGVDKWCVSWRLYSPDGQPLPLDQCPMAVTLKERRAVRDIEIMAERPDGKRIPVLPFPTPLTDADGNFVGAVNVLVDISKLKHAEQEEARRADIQSALYRFTDRLYRATTMTQTTEAALDAITSSLGCPRAAVLLFDSRGIARFVGWRGLSEGYRTAVEGHCPWKVGERDPQPIFVPDIELASESETLKAVVRAESIRALAFIPIVADGGVIGKFMTYDTNSHIFSEEERTLAVTIARQLGFSIERHRAETQRELLVAELSHRVKNTLATVMSIARQTFHADLSMKEARESFDGRIRALAQTHGRLAETNWSGVSFAQLLSDELAPYQCDDGANIRQSGPDLKLPARSAVVLGMAFHELATNAAKHGSLSVQSGRVDVDWRIKSNPRRLHIRWVETNGPNVNPPRRSGFGRLLLEKALAADLRGEVALEFPPGGVTCTLTLPLNDE